MKNQEKTFIGKGVQINDYDMYSISINLSKAEPFVFEFNGEKFLRFTFSKTKNPDMKGRTFTAFVTPMPEKKTAKKPRQKKASQGENFQSQH